MTLSSALGQFSSMRESEISDYTLPATPCRTAGAKKSLKKGQSRVNAVPVI